MKIVLVGAGVTGLGLAAHLAERAAKLGIEAEVRHATPTEEKYCEPILPRAVEPQILVEPLGFEQRRYTGYMDYK